METAPDRFGSCKLAMTNQTKAPRTGVAGFLTSSAVVATGTLASRITGLIRLVVILSVIGDQLFADIFTTANNAPNVILELLLGGVLTATLIPLFVRADAEQDSRAHAAVFTVALATLAVIVAVGIIAAPGIAWLLTVKVDQAHRAAATTLAIQLVRLFIPQVFFYGFTALATAALNARRRFVAAAYAPVANNALAIALMLWLRDKLPRCSKRDPQCALVWATHHSSFIWRLGAGTTLGIAAMAAMLFIPLIKLQIPVLTFRSPLKHPSVRRMVRLSGWTLGYVATNQIAFWFVQTIAQSRSGTNTNYTAAYLFFQLPYGLLAVTIMTTITPEFARAHEARDVPGFMKQFTMGLRYLLLAMIPATAAYCAVAPAIVNILHHRNFKPAAVLLTTDTLIGFTVGLVPFSVYLYTLRAFYAQGNTKTPFRINCFENACNIAFALLLFPHFGVVGLAVAFSAAYFVAAIVAQRALRQTFPHTVGKFDAIPVAWLAAKAMISSGVGFGITWMIARNDRLNLLRSSASAVAGVLVTAAILVALNTEELSEIWAKFRTRNRRAV